ncbi:hypothetical protein [Sandaracinus amylolyticus]|uniref:Uncharacterized protein n=1 Tax=Sandaracinus amylolyticus TaxID=927083 RepID=A0A0F6SF00_9BACT|nr:hypothetical protein [Sandaracinus amylolyticus]AKF06079.1 hypothetical protein DB32_003228 [Sandaracinus amylolyticus]
MSTAHDDLDARLAKARAEMEEVDRAREERASLDAKRARVEAAEREVADAKAIAAAEEKFGRDKIATIKTPLGVVIVKRPNHMHYRKFIGAKDIGPDEAERLVLTCLVHPSRAAFEQIVEEYPAIPTIAATQVVDLAAGRQEELAGKS